MGFGVQTTYNWPEITKISQELEKLNLTLEQLVDRLTPQQATTIRFYVEDGGQTRRIENMFLPVTKMVPVSLKITDKFGNTAPVDGTPAWALTSDGFGTLEVAEDGMSALFKPTGALGALKVQVSADADLGEGVRMIVGELDLEIIAGEAQFLALSAGELLDQAEPSEPVEPVEPTEPQP